MLRRVKDTGQMEECGQCPPQKHADPRQVSSATAFPTLTIQPSAWVLARVYVLVSPHCTIFISCLYSWLDHEVFFANQLKEKVS